MARDRDSDDSKSDRELLLEIIGRSRRIETKITTAVNGMGLEAGEAKPVVNHDERVVWVKTPRVSVEDVLEALEGAEGSYIVRCGTQVLTTVAAP